MALLFAVLCTALLLLPFLPAWREWKYPTDCAPLPVPDDDDADPLYAADRFRRRIAALRAQGPQGGYDTAQQVDAMEPDPLAERARKPVLAVETIRNIGQARSTRPLYALRDLQFKGGAMLHEVMAEGRMALGARSRVTGWAHADRAMDLGEDSVVARRVSSHEAVRVARGCCFEQLHAPAIHFGEAPESAWHALEEPQEADLSALPGVQRRSEALWWVDGDCTLPAGRSFRGSLVVTGVLALGSGSRFEGDVKAHKGLLLGRGAVVTGAAVCQNGMQLLPHAQVWGPLAGETHLVLASGTRLGRPGAPTTVTATTLVVEEGVVVHGTVWARQAGVVWGVSR